MIKKEKPYSNVAYDVLWQMCTKRDLTKNKKIIYSINLVKKVLRTYFGAARLEDLTNSDG